MMDRSMQRERDPEDHVMESQTAHENVLEIKVIEHTKGQWHAYYNGSQVHVSGSTPYMAARALIDAFNTTDEWNRRYAQKA